MAGSKEKRIEQEQRQEASHQKAIKAELEWVRSNQKVAKQRIKRACNALMSSTPRNFRAATRPMKSTYRLGTCLGDKVIEVSGLRKTFGDRLC
ncbi:MAG: hypothetical protein CM15mP89_2670 [Gammaproteobacteria bacterium]|nr:MAG: hypothetical protein CM15mP89_2670 [Gammaproteobacteria bacterium]